MKMKSAKALRRVVNTTLIPVNQGIMLVNMTIKFAPLTWTLAKFAAGRPQWLLNKRRDLRQIGLYQFVDCRGHQFNTLLLDSRMTTAIEVSEGHAVRQMVLNQLREEVAVDTRCPDFEVPAAIYLWGHPSKGFKKIVRLRDATRSERKEYVHLVRQGVDEFIDGLSAMA